MSTENKYHPLTESEYLELKGKIESIRDYLPEMLLTYVWSTYKRISGSNENQPCGCKTAAGLWRKAVDVLQDYIKRVESV
jgi:hypothetical protein